MTIDLPSGDREISDCTMLSALGACRFIASGYSVSCLISLDLLVGRLGLTCTSDLVSGMVPLSHMLLHLVGSSGCVRTAD